MGAFMKSRTWAIAILLVPFLAAPAAAQSSSAISDYFNGWSDRVAAAQASQPDWITPLATVTPRLEQEFRYDQYFEQLGNGGNLRNFDSGKGLELIPTTTNEILINLPPYQERTVKKPAAGFADWPLLTVKQRFISANNDNGNYIVTGFIGLQAPTGIAAYRSHAWIITPTLAAGKGWGDFDIQGTVGMPIPLSAESIIGTSIVSNITLQYHIDNYFWPEFEMNLTHWNDGQRAGRTQIFLTPGIVFGRFHLTTGLRGILGVGYQFAVSPHMTIAPVLTPTYQRSLILSARLAF